MQRQRTLERAGWRFWRCFASRFVRERQAVLDELCILLDSLGIKPRAADRRSTTYTEYKEWRSVSSEDVQVEIDGDEGHPSSNGIDEVFSESPAHLALVDDIPVVEDDPLPDTSIAPSAERFRTTETEIQAAILELMSDGQVWTNAQLKQRIPELIALTPGDRQRSSSRPQEEKWEELVNNALTRTGRSNSLYVRGLVVNVGFGQHRRVTDGPRNK